MTKTRTTTVTQSTEELPRFPTLRLRLQQRQELSQSLHRIPSIRELRELREERRNRQRLERREGYTTAVNELYESRRAGLTSTNFEIYRRTRVPCHPGTLVEQSTVDRSTRLQPVWIRGYHRIHVPQNRREEYGRILDRLWDARQGGVHTQQFERYRMERSRNNVYTQSAAGMNERPVLQTPGNVRGYRERPRPSEERQHEVEGRIKRMFNARNRGLKTSQWNSYRQTRLSSEQIHSRSTSVDVNNFNGEKVERSSIKEPKNRMGRQTSAPTILENPGNAQTEQIQEAKLRGFERTQSYPAFTHTEECKSAGRDETRNTSSSERTKSQGSLMKESTEDVSYITAPTVPRAPETCVRKSECGLPKTTKKENWRKYGRSAEDVLSDAGRLLLTPFIQRAPSRPATEPGPKAYDSFGGGWKNFRPDLSFGTERYFQEERDRKLKNLMKEQERENTVREFERNNNGQAVIDPQCDRLSREKVRAMGFTEPHQDQEFERHTRAVQRAGGAPVITLRTLEGEIKHLVKNNSGKWEELNISEDQVSGPSAIIVQGRTNNQTKSKVGRPIDQSPTETQRLLERARMIRDEAVTAEREKLMTSSCKQDLSKQCSVSGEDDEREQEDGHAMRYKRNVENTTVQELLQRAQLIRDEALMAEHWKIVGGEPVFHVPYIRKVQEAIQKRRVTVQYEDGRQNIMHLTREGDWVENEHNEESLKKEGGNEKSESKAGESTTGDIISGNDFQEEFNSNPFNLLDVATKLLLFGSVKVWDRHGKIISLKQEKSGLLVKSNDGYTEDKQNHEAVDVSGNIISEDSLADSSCGSDEGDMSVEEENEWNKMKQHGNTDRIFVRDRYGRVAVYIKAGLEDWVRIPQWDNTSTNQTWGLEGGGNKKKFTSNQDASSAGKKARVANNQPTGLGAKESVGKKTRKGQTTAPVLRLRSGLFNPDNRCYMNSSLQALLSLRSINEWLTAHRQKTHEQRHERCFSCALGDVSTRMKENETPQSALEIWNLRNDLSSEFGENVQQDAAEFIFKLLDELQAEQEREANQTGDDSNMYKCTMKSSTRCKECQNGASRTLNGGLLGNVNLWDINSVQAGLDVEFGNWNPIDGSTCRGCGKRGTSETCMQIIKPADILVVNLLRFINGENKIEKPITINEKVVLRIPGEREKVYNLKAVIAHHGEDTNAGHYTTIERLNNGILIEYNDTKQSVSRSIVDLPQTAYVILYEKENDQSYRPESLNDNQPTTEEEARYEEEISSDNKTISDNEDDFIEDGLGREPDVKSTSTSKLRESRECPLLEKRNTDMTTLEIREKLQGIQDNKIQTQVITHPPYNVKGGHVYAYRLRHVRDNDFLRDGITGFKQSGTFVSKGVRRTYYKLVSRSKNGQREKTSGFHKIVYTLEAIKNNEGSIVLIHYIGDETVVEQRPHGNSKQSKPFVQNTKTTKFNIENALGGLQNPKRIYMDNQKAAKAEFEDDFDEIEAVVTARNTKQVSNIKHAVEKKKRLTNDEMYSIAELRLQGVADFVKIFYLAPYDIICIADPAAIEFTKTILQESSCRPELPQLLTYDTTFNLTDVYVSALVVRNIFMDGNPIFPAAFMLHNRKHKDVHEVFWQKICEDVLGLSQYVEQFPVTMDRERGILRAVRNVFPNVNLVFCHNHILQDEKRWIIKQGGTADDRTALTKMLQKLLACETEERFNLLYSKYKEMWSEGFAVYMKNHIKEDLRKSSKFMYSKYPCFMSCVPTQNASESLNAMIKRETNRKEMPRDLLMLQLHQLQLEFLSDIIKSSKIGGNFNPKPEYREKLQQVQLPFYVGFTQERFLEIFRNDAGFKERNANPTNLESQRMLAFLCQENNLVTLDSKSKSFIVISPYGNTRNVVYKDESAGKYLCSCPSITGHCFHIASVELVNAGQPVREAKKKYKLSKLIRRGRRGETKGGRKKPRALDIEADVIAADDSILSMRNRLSTITEEEDVAEVSDIWNDTNQTNLSQVEPKFQSTPKSKTKSSLTQAWRARKLKRLSTINSTKVAVTAKKTAVKKIPFHPCLRPKKWLTDVCLEGGIHIYIEEANLFSLIVNSYPDLNAAAKNNETSRLIKTVAQQQYLDYELILQPINTDVDPKSKGLHWILGGISFREKLFFLLDSMESSPADYETAFKNLVSIATAAYACVGVQLELNGWRFVQGNDSIQQANGYDCGLFVLAHVRAMLQETTFQAQHPGQDSKSCRNTLKEKLREFNVTGPHCNTLRRKENLSVKLHEEQITSAVKMLEHNKKFQIKIMKKPLEKRLSKLVQSMRESNDANWTICEAGPRTCHHDTGHDIPQKFCNLCRKWFHEGCREVLTFKIPQPNYSICKKCQKKHCVAESLLQQEARQDLVERPFSTQTKQLLVVIEGESTITEKPENVDEMSANVKKTQTDSDAQPLGAGYVSERNSFAERQQTKPTKQSYYDQFKTIGLVGIENESGHSSDGSIWPEFDLRENTYGAEENTQASQETTASLQALNNFFTEAALNARSALRDPEMMKLEGQTTCCGNSNEPADKPELLQKFNALKEFVKSDEYQAFVSAVDERTRFIESLTEDEILDALETILPEVTNIASGVTPSVRHNLHQRSLDSQDSAQQAILDDLRRLRTLYNNFTDEQLELIAEQIDRRCNFLRSDDDTANFYYTQNVLLPEVILRLYAHFFETTYEEAEKQHS